MFLLKWEKLLTPILRAPPLPVNWRTTKSSQRNSTRYGCREANESLIARRCRFWKNHRGAFKYAHCKRQ